MCTKKVARTVTMVLLYAGMAAAVSAGGRQPQQAAAGVEILDLYGGEGMSALTTTGIQEGAMYMDLWKEDLGIQFNVVSPASTDNFNTMVASGNLPDILFISNPSDLITLIRAGLILNLDEYQDKLPDLYRNAPALVQYRRDAMSNGTGGLYGVARAGLSVLPSSGAENAGLHLRWDYYKELGMPELVDIEDYLPLLKRMVDAHPVNEAGQRVYGISMFSDWGGVSGGPDAINWYGKLQYGFLEIDPVNGTGTSIVDNNSYYKRTMLLLFNANQMGILDPDSITQGYSDMLAKGKAGRVLFSPFSWGTPGQFRTPEREAAGIGYRLVPFKNAKLVRGSDTRADPFGNHIWSWAVGKNTKHLDKALAFINYLYSYDGCWLMQNGRQGVKWDLDENGEPYLTQAGVDIQYNGVPYPNGGTQGNASGIYQGLDVKTIHPVYGRQINTADWVKKDYIPQDSALVLDWRRLMNAQDDVDYYIKNNIYINPPFAPMDPAPDSIALAQNRVNEVVVPLSWQMIYAKDRAEFDRLWAEMTEQARGRGLDTVNDWYRDAYARAKVTGAKYVNIR